MYNVEQYNITKQNMKNKVLLLPLVFMALACTSDEQKAGEMYAQAEQYYLAGEYTTATQWVDSIEATYPRAFDVIRNGMMLQCLINQKVYEQELLLIDSLYNIAQNELNTLKPQFDLVREGEYQTVANYIYKKHRPSAVVTKSELRSQVTEKGEFQLTSVVYGNKVNHTGISIEQSDGSFARSATIAHDGAKNYRYNDDGKPVEMITYNMQQCRQVVDMIALSSDSKLKVQYTGGKKFSITLDKKSSDAITQTYRLAQVMALVDSLSLRRQYGIKQLELADRQLIKLEEQAIANE